MSVTPMVSTRIQRILTSSGDDFCESLELDPRSIELLSRTKPCLKIMLSETELEVIAGGQK